MTPAYALKGSNMANIKHITEMNSPFCHVYSVEYDSGAIKVFRFKYGVPKTVTDYIKNCNAVESKIGDRTVTEFIPK